MILENTNCKNSAKNEIRSPFLTTEDAKVCAEDAEEEPVTFFLCVLCVKSLRPLRLMDLVLTKG
jgi:hypothetical protein